VVNETQLADLRKVALKRVTEFESGPEMDALSSALRLQQISEVCEGIVPPVGDSPPGANG
jgi:hypothetical protein